MIKNLRHNRNGQSVFVTALLLEIGHIRSLLTNRMHYEFQQVAQEPQSVGKFYEKKINK